MRTTRLRAYVLFLLGLAVVWWLLVLIYPDNTIPEHSWGEVLLRQSESIADVPAAKATTTRVVVVGDVFLGRDVEDGARQHGFTYPLALFQAAPFASSDSLIINFEAPVPSVHRPTPDLSTRFSVASSAVSALASVGVTHAGLANNHTGDFGFDGFLHTQEQFINNDLEPFGHPWSVSSSSVAVIETVQGDMAVVALHAVHTLPNATDLERLFASLPLAPAGVVVYVHWGDEYQMTANPTQRQLAEELVAYGADLIVGHHPHVVQDIELVDGVPVFYSLGNTVFDQYFSVAVQTGLVLTLEYSDQGRQVSLQPISSLGSRTRPYLMPARERERFLQDLAKRSDPSLATAIEAGVMSW